MNEITTYEIRSVAGNPLMRVDSLARVREIIAERSAKVPGLRLFRVTVSAQEVELC